MEPDVCKEIPEETGLRDLLRDEQRSRPVTGVAPTVEHEELSQEAPVVEPELSPVRDRVGQVLPDGQAHAEEEEHEGTSGGSDKMEVEEGASIRVYDGGREGGRRMGVAEAGEGEEQVEQDAVGGNHRDQRLETWYEDSHPSEHDGSSSLTDEDNHPEKEEGEAGGAKLLSQTFIGGEVVPSGKRMMSLERTMSAPTGTIDEVSYKETQGRVMDASVEQRAMGFALAWNRSRMFRRLSQSLDGPMKEVLVHKEFSPPTVGEVEEMIKSLTSPVKPARRNSLTSSSDKGGEGLPAEEQQGEETFLPFWKVSDELDEILRSNHAKSLIDEDGKFSTLIKTRRRRQQIRNSSAIILQRAVRKYLHAIHERPWIEHRKVKDQTGKWIHALIPHGTADGMKVFRDEVLLCSWWREKVPEQSKKVFDLSRAKILLQPRCQGRSMQGRVSLQEVQAENSARSRELNIMLDRYADEQIERWRQKFDPYYSPALTEEEERGRGEDVLSTVLVTPRNEKRLRVYRSGAERWRVSPLHLSRGLAAADAPPPPRVKTLGVQQPAIRSYFHRKLHHLVAPEARQEGVEKVRAVAEYRTGQEQERGEYYPHPPPKRGGNGRLPKLKQRRKQEAADEGAGGGGTAEGMEARAGAGAGVGRNVYDRLISVLRKIADSLKLESSAEGLLFKKELIFEIEDVSKDLWEVGDEGTVALLQRSKEDIQEALYMEVLAALQQGGEAD